MIYSCIGKNSNSKNTDTNMPTFNDSVNRIFNIYNRNNQLIKQSSITFEYWNKEKKRSEISTYYYYDFRGNLIKKVILSSNNPPDSLITFFVYNIENNLIKKVELDYERDTSEIEINEYITKKNKKETKSTIIKRNLLSIDKKNRDFDTTVTWLEEIYSDSLIKKMLYYELHGYKRVLKETTFYSYNFNGKLEKSYTLDSNFDTVSQTLLKYSDVGKLTMKKKYLNKINYVSTELFDSNGCIYKLINIDKNLDLKDTFRYKCDKNCNVIEIISYPR